jgi:hypothetical protein
VGPFFDFVGADSFAFSAKGGSQKFGRQVGLIMFPTTKSNSGRSIATHPCKKRKGGAPSVGMVHAKMVKGGPPAFTISMLHWHLTLITAQVSPSLEAAKGYTMPAVA